MVHRDLASRNLLLDDGFHVRISDFGFSRVKRECASRGYTRSDMGPIKWTSPEAMRKRWVDRARQGGVVRSRGRCTCVVVIQSLSCSIVVVAHGVALQSQVRYSTAVVARYHLVSAFQLWLLHVVFLQSQLPCSIVVATNCRPSVSALTRDRYTRSQLFARGRYARGRHPVSTITRGGFALSSSSLSTVQSWSLHVVVIV